MAPANATAPSMVKLERGHRQTFDPAMVRRVMIVAGGRIIVRELVETGNVDEAIDLGHVRTHVVSPFEDLGSDVHQKGVGGPPAEDHDAGGAMVHKKESHRRARAEGRVAKVGGVETIGVIASGQLAGRA